MAFKYDKKIVQKSIYKMILASFFWTNSYFD